MSDTMFDYLLMWKDEIDNTLKDKYINNYMHWKYEKYKYFDNLYLMNLVYKGE